MALQKVPFTDLAIKYVLGGSHTHTQCIEARDSDEQNKSPVLPKRVCASVGVGVSNLIVNIFKIRSCGAKCCEKRRQHKSDKDGKLTM